MLGADRGLRPGRFEPPREPPIPFAPFTRAIELTPGKAEFIEWTPTSLVCRDGATGKVRWDAFHPAKPFETNRDPARWMRKLAAEHSRGKLIAPAPDLNADGTHDLLWFFPDHAAFLACSGKDGSLLWSHVARLDGPGGPKAEAPEISRRDQPASRNGSIIGTPAIADVDRDGTPDLIATIGFWETPAETDLRPAPKSADGQPLGKGPLLRRSVMAISAREGRWLWTFPVDQTFKPHSSEIWNRPAIWLQGRQRALVVILDGGSWLGLDPATRKPKVGPFDLGFSPLPYARFSMPI